MTEQEIKDFEAYQASLPGTAATLVFELERVTKAIQVMADNSNTIACLMPEVRSFTEALRRMTDISDTLLLRMHS